MLYRYEIKIPKDIKQEWFEDKVRFIGTKEQTSLITREFRRLQHFNDGDLVKLGNLTLKISNRITNDSKKKNWIELPSEAWALMAKEFFHVREGKKQNPFDFKDVDYPNKNVFDIGIEITDIRLSFTRYLKNSYSGNLDLLLFKTKNNNFYSLIEGNRNAEKIKEYLETTHQLRSYKHQKSTIKTRFRTINRYRFYFQPNQKKQLINALQERNRIFEQKIEENNRLAEQFTIQGFFAVSFLAFTLSLLPMIVVSYDLKQFLEISWLEAILGLYLFFWFLCFLFFCLIPKLMGKK